MGLGSHAADALPAAGAGGENLASPGRRPRGCARGAVLVRLGVSGPGHRAGTSLSFQNLLEGPFRARSANRCLTNACGCPSRPSHLWPWGRDQRWPRLPARCPGSCGTRLTQATRNCRDAARAPRLFRKLRGAPPQDPGRSPARSEPVVHAGRGAAAPRCAHLRSGPLAFSCQPDDPFPRV